MIVLFDLYIKLFAPAYKELLICTSLKFLISKFNDVIDTFGLLKSTPKSELLIEL